MQRKKTALFIKQKLFVCLFFKLYFPIKLLYLLYYAEADNEFAGPISAKLHLQWGAYKASHYFLKVIILLFTCFQTVYLRKKIGHTKNF